LIIISLHLVFLHLFLTFLNRNNRKDVITTKFPQHPYGTCANRRRMKNLAEAVDSVKNDVNQLKDQIGQILEALAAMKSTRENSMVRNDEATSSDLVVQQIGMVPVPRLDHTGWPPYGLSPNYTPPYEGQQEHEQLPPLILVNPSGTPANQPE